MSIKSTKEEFIIKSIKKHGDKFNYDFVEYINSKIKVDIVCPKHGMFKQRPNDHLTGYGCIKCQYEKTSKENKHTNEIFIKKATEKHNGLYDYSLVEYDGYEKTVNIICKKHGVFKQTPHNHTNGAGCPNCSESRGEREVSRILEKLNIFFVKQKTFYDLKDKSNLYYDFYLPKYKLFIEYHGIQHMKPIKFFGGKDALMSTMKRDMIKYNYALNNGYKILTIFNVPPEYLEEQIIQKFRYNNII